MSLMAVFAPGSSLLPPTPKPKFSNRRLVRDSSCFNVRHRLLMNVKQCRLFRPQTFRIRSFSKEDSENDEAGMSDDILDGKDGIDDELLGNVKNIQTGAESSFLAKIAIALGIAATVTLISVIIKGPTIGSSSGPQFLPESSSSSAMATAPVGFTFKVFGYSIVLPEYAPGWIYFWLLMAAGCGLFISEEALNIWVCPLLWLAYH